MLLFSSFFFRVCFLWAWLLPVQWISSVHRPWRQHQLKNITQYIQSVVQASCKGAWVCCMGQGWWITLVNSRAVLFGVCNSYIFAPFHPQTDVPFFFKVPVFSSLLLTKTTFCSSATVIYFWLTLHKFRSPSGEFGKISVKNLVNPLERF